MKTKAIVNFKPFSQTGLCPVAERIHAQMVKHAGVFEGPPVSMVELGGFISNYKARLVAKVSRARVDKAAFDAARGALLTALARLGGYVNTRAMGEALMVEQSGFPSYAMGRVLRSGPPEAPADLRLKHGRVSGSVVGRYVPDRQHSMNVVQVALLDPGDEADWRQAGIFPGSKALLTGLKPGTSLWVRVATVGRNGLVGAWSDPAQIWVV